MFSLSLGRDGCVKAAAPAPRIECALLRCAAFVAVQLFFCWQHSQLHHWRRREPTASSDAAMQQEGWCEGSSEVVKHTSSASTRSLRINFAVNQCL